MNKLKLPRGRNRNTVTLLLVCFLAALLLALNLLFPYAMRRSNVYIDMTPEGLYTLTDAMKTEVAELDTDVEVLFLAPEDRLLDNSLLRYVYIMCRKLSDVNDRISVRTVDLMQDPTAADRFKTAQGTTISASDVIVSSGDRFKILSSDSFFSTENEEIVAFNGEYRLATAILSVTTYAEGPYAYFAVGNGEKYYIEGDAGSDPTLSVFASQLRDVGLRVGKIDLETEEIPDDCVLLIFAGTEEDYDKGNIYDFDSPSPLKKLDKFLYEKKSVMFFRSALAPSLPNIEDYLAEWGIAFTSTRVTAPDESLANVTTGVKTGERLVAVYPDEDVDAPAYAMIKDIASLATPPKVVISNATALEKTFVSTPVYTSASTSRSVCPVFYAGASAKATDAQGYAVDAKDGRYILAMMGMEASLSAGEHRYAYVFAAGSTEMISNAYLGDSAFGNGDVMASVIRSISRTDVYASGSVGGFDPNSTAYGGKWFDETHLSNTGVNTVVHSQTEWDEYKQLKTGSVVLLSIVIFILPVVVLPATAIVVLRRRRNK